jgi:hypothetical protein
MCCLVVVVTDLGGDDARVLSNSEMMINMVKPKKLGEKPAPVPLYLLHEVSRA